MKLATLVALPVIFAGCAMFYLASPHQALRHAAWPPRSAVPAGLALLVVGLAMLCLHLQAAAAAFTFCISLMLAWVALPYLGALAGARRAAASQTAVRRPPIQRDWLSKTVAGTVLGLAFALACSGWFVHVAADLPLSVKGQLAMWLVPPVWVAVLGVSYVLQSGARAWLCLAGPNTIAWGLLAATQHLS